MTARRNIANLSAYFDASNLGRFRAMTREELEAELALLHRTIKVGEEFGESVDATIGITGANPRKGRYGSIEDAIDEQLDIALTALGNVEHLIGNSGGSLELLEDHIAQVAQRAGVAA